MLSECNAWIRNFHRAPSASVNLVCFPHAGGSASFYFQMSRLLAPDIQVLAIQYPGRQDRVGEPPVTTVAELADPIAAAIASLPDKPLAVFGHSMGASVAYEVALRLQAAGKCPTALLVSARRAPHRTLDTGLHRLPDDELLEQVRTLSGAGKVALEDTELSQIVLPAIRADYTAAETYQYAPRPPLDCAVDALAGAADPLLPAAEMRHWAQYTSAPFRLRIFAGGHFYISDHQSALSRLLAERLAGLG